MNLKQKHLRHCIPRLQHIKVPDEEDDDDEEEEEEEVEDARFRERFFFGANSSSAASVRLLFSPGGSSKLNTGSLAEDSAFERDSR